MKNRLNFLFLLLYSYRAKHFSIFIIASFMIALVATTLFISSSIKRDLEASLSKQASFIVQRYQGGRVLQTPLSWVDEFLEIEGVTSVTGRIYGLYYYEQLENYFLIVGIDPYEEQTSRALKELVSLVDVEKFEAQNSMIIGAGVKKFFDRYEYKEYYIFRPPDRSKKRVYIAQTFPKNSALFSNDMIVMKKDFAKKILGIDEGFVSDITINVRSEAELQTIKTKLILSHFDMRVISKEDIARHYENLYNYKSGVFLALFLTSLLTFMLILYQRYSMVSTKDAKEIALLRLLGWKVKSIIFLKLGENFLVAFFAYIVGVITAYIYVYFFNAPLIKNIFLGYKNLEVFGSFSYLPEPEVLLLLFLLFVIPFLLAILIPLYRVSVSEPMELMQ